MPALICTPAPCTAAGRGDDRPAIGGPYRIFPTARVRPRPDGVSVHWTHSSPFACFPSLSEAVLRPGHAFGYLISCFMAFCLALGISLPPAVAAGDGSIGEARAAYVAGWFVEAARIAEMLRTAEGYALAAESLTIHAHHIAADSERERLLERAIELAEKAVDSDPDNANAHLQLARAIGRHAQAIGSIEAAGRGYAKRIREATETALRLEPGMAAAHLSLGLWNAEVIAAVGPFMARLIYGARKKNALAAFERALQLAPHAKAVPLEYALGLLALDGRDYRERAAGLLRRAIRIPAEDAYDRLLHERAVERLEALESLGGREPAHDRAGIDR